MTKLIFKSLLFLGYLTFMTESFAYMNVEAVRQRQREGFLGRMGVSVSGNSGNTETFNGKASTINDYKTHDDEFLLFGEYKYGESFDEEIEHWGSLHLRYAKEFESFPTFEYFTQGEFNEFTRTNSRFLTGPVLRHKIFDQEKRSLFLGTGVYYERENIDDGDINKTSRANVYLSYLHKLRKGLEFSLISYYQPSLEETSDYWLIVDTGLSIELNSFISYDIEVDYLHDNNPPSRVKRDDLSYYTGLSITY